MVAELGQTSDPKELIPGDAAAINEAMRQLSSHASTVEGVGAGLGAVRADSWLGQASDRFFATLADVKPQWLAANDAITSASALLGRHADAVAWAQGAAADAIDLWERGEAATRQATENHQKAVAAAATTPGSVVAPLTDPGERLRTEAKELLERARTQLSEVGDTVAGELGAKSGKTGGGPPLLEAIGTAVRTHGQQVDMSTSLDIASRTLFDEKNPLAINAREKFGYDFSKMPSDDLPKVDLNLPSAELAKVGVEHGLFDHSVSGAANVGGMAFDGTAQVHGGAEGSATVTAGVDGVTAAANASAGVGAAAAGAAQLGALQANAAGEVFAGGTAGASATLGKDGLAAQANASAGVRASGEANARLGIAEAGASGEAFAGAEAEAKASVGADGVHAGVEAFAGARASGELSGSVAGVGGTVTGEAWAGVGAEAKLDIGPGEDGKWRIGGEIGAGIGVGGKVGGEITVDPGEIAGAAQDAAGKVGEAAKGIGDAANLARNNAGTIAGALNPFD